MPLTDWRLTTPPYADLSGEGARRAGRRWDPRGAAVVYAGGHPAIAVAEYLVHVRDPEDLPDALVFLRSVVPDDVGTAAVTRGDLKRADPKWRRAGAPACLTVGAAWLAPGAAAVLRVLSAVVPLAGNILLNPARLDARRCVSTERVLHMFEPRRLDPARR